ncbi:unnamed protein product [Schistocephalus solidus]|uniref:Uncharacterized protein n=1 Tax=Schistocephalus solidus TaxID=70667 RepID=A0A3P7BPT8_SCHSO|nr:unnamed protein product [Schistocephalus solidus]
MKMLNSRLQHVQNLTDKTIEDARRAKEMYKHLTLERYEEVCARLTFLILTRLMPIL